MSCSTMDLKAYFLGEADRREKADFEAHLTACAHCREELDRLQLTHSALRSLPDEEMPQRIAFVSDRVFEPRWWQTLWRSGPAAIFASAVLLAAAILVHATVRPAPAGAPAAAQIDTAKLERRIEREVGERVQTAVARAVADLATRQSAETARVAQATRKHVEAEYRPVLAAAQQAMTLYQQQMGRLTVAANYTRGEQQ